MLLSKSILELADLLQKKEISVVDIVTECYANIENYNSKINAFITIIDKNEVLKKAAELDKNHSGITSKLWGIPFVMKDSYLTKGIRTTAASKVLENYLPQYNATVYQKLVDAGAILIGKTNMDAWGHGATSENTDFGPVKNPYDQTKTAGGSTGGVAAALACRMAVFGIGEDTGGSIRNPSAWCNVTGLKVTYGRVSRYGCIAYASSFDTVGPMAKTAQDCAVVLETIAGLDAYDATSSPHEVDAYSETVSHKITELTIGVPMDLLATGVDKEIKQAVEASLDVYKQVGFKIKEISLPFLKYGIPVYYLIAPSETSSNLGRYDGIRYGNDRSNFTDETMRRIMIGTFALSTGYYDAYYKKAQAARTIFINAYKEAFKECDVILMPVTPNNPSKLGEVVDDPVQNMLIDFFTVTQNPVGIPSLALPAGFTSSNLPIGMQIMAPMFCESLLLQVAHEYQKVTDWHTRMPKFDLI